MAAILRNRNGGFSLVEAIVASLILSGAALTIGAISTRSLSYTRDNRNFEKAVQIASQQLTMIDYVGLDAFLAMGSMEGEIEDAVPKFHWSVETEEFEEHDLSKVYVTVSWEAGTRSRSVELATIVASSGSLALEEEPAGEQVDTPTR